MYAETNELFYYIRQGFYDRFKSMFNNTKVKHISEFPTGYFAEGPKVYDYVISAPLGWYESLEEIEQFLLEQETEIIGLRLLANYIKG